jgi:Asp-tRNA(Asn)/Glu-tRNA(Gln) amidotransferase B subunit
MIISWQRVLGFFVGNVLKLSQGKANPKLVTDVVKKLLDEGQ